MTNKHDEKYTSHEAIKEWEQEKDQNNLTQNIVALLGIHGMHCMFYNYQNASHITKAFESLFHTHTKEVREHERVEEMAQQEWLLVGDVPIAQEWLRQTLTTLTKEVREHTLAEVREKYKLIPKQSKRDKAKDEEKVRLALGELGVTWEDPELVIQNIIDIINEAK